MATESLAGVISSDLLISAYSIRNRELISLAIAGASTASPTLSKWVGLSGTIAAESDCHHGVVYISSLIGAYARVFPALTIPEEALEDTDIGYFMGAYGGGVYEWDDDYKGDAGTAIMSAWQSKNLDFDDQVQGVGDLYKAIERVKLYFVDTNETDVTVSISTDDGLNWTNVTKTLGSGTNDPAEYNYDFWLSGHRFRFKLGHSSSSDNFQWARMEIFGTAQGEHYTVSA